MTERIQNEQSRIQADRCDGCCVWFVNCVVHDVTDRCSLRGENPSLDRLARCNPASIKHTTNTRRHRHGPRSRRCLCSGYDEHGSLRINESNILPSQAEALIGPQTCVEDNRRHGAQRLRTGVEVRLFLLWYTKERTPSSVFVYNCQCRRGSTSSATGFGSDRKELSWEEIEEIPRFKELVSS